MSDDIPDTDDIGVPDGDGESWDEAAERLSAQSIRTDNVELQHTVQKLAKQHAESFAEYIIEEAENHVTPERFDTDAVRDSIKCLGHWGYRITDRADESGERGIGFAHPEQFNTLRDDVSESVRLGGDGLASANGDHFGVYAVDIHADASLPKGTAIILHADAIAPTPPHEAASMLGPNQAQEYTATQQWPWLVKDPKGVVVVEVQS
jgi:hypothetical protein